LVQLDCVAPVGLVAEGIEAEGLPPFGQRALRMRIDVPMRIDVRIRCRPRLGVAAGDRRSSDYEGGNYERRDQDAFHVMPFRLFDF